MRKDSSIYPEGYYMCDVCKKLLPLTEEYFYKNKSKKNGFTTECKDCKKAYQLIRNRKLRQLRKDFIFSKGNRCNSCNLYNENPRFFDIDHIIPVVKTKEPRSLPSYYDDKKLQVLCPNCHREKTINDIKNKNENKDIVL